MHFDARAAKLLQPGQHLVVEGAQGLRLVASASRRAWVYRFKDSSGRMKQTKLGEWPAMAFASALAAWQGLRDVRAAGDDPRAPKRSPVAEPASCLVSTVVDGYVTGHLRPLGTASALAAERALDRLLLESPDLAGKPAERVTRAEAFAVLDARKQYPTAAARLRSLLAAAWSYGHDAGTLPDTAPNWWRDVMRGRLKSKGKIVGGEHQGPARKLLRLEDVHTLLAWAGEHMHPLGRDTLTLYLWTCARGGEILSMRPEHLREESSGWWWTVPVALTKNAGNPNAVDLRVPLIGRAREVVLRRLDAVGKGGWLFATERGEPYTQHDFSTYVYDLQPYSTKARRAAEHGRGEARERLPVAGWTPHNLRRTSRTLLAGLGCPREVAEAILGHLPGVVEATYNRYTYDAERVAWLGKLAALLDGLPARP